MIAHNSPCIGQAEADAAERVLRSGWLARGRETQAFETELAAFLGIPPTHVVATSSGTAALFLALWALGAKGKEVAIPGYVCSAVRNAVVMAAGQPHFIDNAPKSVNVDVEEIRSSVCELAVVPHMYGIPQDVSPLLDRMPVIEDCAQAFGARVAGQAAGLLGTVGITSFYATKLLTTGGQGGAVFSRDRPIIDAIRDYLDFDCRTDEMPRFNYQVTDMQSAIGRVQLSRYAEFLERRETIFARYRSCGLDLLDTASSSVLPVRYRAIVRTPNPGKLIALLAEHDVRAIVPTGEWELPGAGALPHARALTHETVSLPIYPALDDTHIARVVHALERACT